MKDRATAKRDGFRDVPLVFLDVSELYPYRAEACVRFRKQTGTMVIRKRTAVIR